MVTFWERRITKQGILINIFQQRKISLVALFFFCFMKFNLAVVVYCKSMEFLTKSMYFFNE